MPSDRNLHDRAKARVCSRERIRFFTLRRRRDRERGKSNRANGTSTSKWRSFSKILNHAYDDATSANHMAEGSRARPLRVCDLGSATPISPSAYSLLTNKKDIPTDVVGVDIKRQAREHNSSGRRIWVG